MKKLLSLPYTFVLLNWAALVAFYYFFTNKQVVWVKTQTPPISDNGAWNKETTEGTESTG